MGKVPSPLLHRYSVTDCVLLHLVNGINAEKEFSTVIQIKGTKVLGVFINEFRRLLYFQ